MGAFPEKFESMLNAVLGDHLERRGNSLSIELAFYEAGQPLVLSADALRRAYPGLTPRVVVLVHGMAQTEACWSFPRDPACSYGTLLRDELGLTPLYVRYNTGRHISENGRDLALLLERLLTAYPVPLQEITLLGHSLGGLVIRSACHYAERLSLSWLERTRRAFYLGAPHLGSPLEKAGHWLSLVLGAIDHPVVRLTGTLGNLRSAGVKDLRHGSLLDEDWQGRDLDAFDLMRPRPVPLHPGIQHFLIAGALTQSEAHFITRLFGDAFVRLPSATDPGRRAGLPSEHFAVFPGVHHMLLSHSPEVYTRLRSWFGEPAGKTAALTTTEPEPEASTEQPRAAERRFERIEGYRALLEEAVDQGVTAVQRVQEELTRRPYDVLSLVPPLEAPTALVRGVHFAAIGGVYATIRGVNSLAGVALQRGLAWVGKQRPS
jgi:pimeloyl-ACP methyl ester carboxylesterase